MEPGHLAQDERLDRRIFLAGIAIIGLGMAFLTAMVLVFFPEWISPRALAPEGGTSTVRAVTLLPLGVRDRWWISDLSAPDTAVAKRSRNWALASENPPTIDALRHEAQLENQVAGAPSPARAGRVLMLEAGAGRDDRPEGATAELAAVTAVLDAIPGENGAVSGGASPQSAGSGPDATPGGARGQSTYLHIAVDRSGRNGTQQVLSGTVVAIGKGSITLQTEDGLFVVKVQGNTVILIDGQGYSLSDLTVGQSVIVTTDVGGKFAEAPAGTASASEKGPGGRSKGNGPPGQAAGIFDRLGPVVAHAP